jgi:hypothetical protein
MATAQTRTPSLRPTEGVVVVFSSTGGLTAKQYYPSSSAVAHHSTPEQPAIVFRGGIRQVLISEERSDPGKLADEIWVFMAGALRSTAGSDIEKRSSPRSICGRPTYGSRYGSESKGDGSRPCPWMVLWSVLA